MRPLIHIGYHKTATTWFQKRLYPQVEDRRYIERRHVQRVLLSPTAFEFDARIARDQLVGDELQFGAVILCEEELSGNPHTGGMRGFQSLETARRLQQVLPDADIVVVVRNQVDMAASLYAHYIREGGTRGAARYFQPASWRKDVARHPFKYPLFSWDYLDYRGLIRHYQALFGVERVHVFCFEDFLRDIRAFIPDFVQRLGLRVTLGEDLSFEAENRGYGINALRVGRLLNLFTYRSVLDKQYLVPLLSNKLRSRIPQWIAAGPFAGAAADAERVLPPSLIADLHAYFGPRNNELAELLDRDLGTLGYPLVNGDPMPSS
ncbi:MAG: hypothetical protein ABFS23_03975 [Pseudomonadota bacterium]